MSIILIYKDKQVTLQKRFFPFRFRFQREEKKRKREREEKVQKHRARPLDEQKEREKESADKNGGKVWSRRCRQVGESSRDCLI